MAEPAVPLPALWRHFPALSEILPCHPLGIYPTPLEPLPPELAGPAAWIKRDDQTARPYGGNKVRKLELLLADALRRGARRLVTAGAFGSHHCLATAIYGRQVGLPVTCLLFPQQVTPHVREVLAGLAAAGAELRFVPRVAMIPIALAAARTVRLRDAPYLIAPGGSDALGTLGYASAGLELAGQIKAGGMPVPAEVHVAAGTLGTAAGIALGLHLGGLRDTEVVAVRITSRLVTNERALVRLVRGACSRLRRAGLQAPDERGVLSQLRIEHGQIGDGYGRETQAGREAARRFAQAGLHLDATYTAKAAASFLAAQPGRPRLFWHTLSAHAPPAPADALSSLPRVFQRRIAGETTSR
jgi:D-cysteine desulfhydrase